MDGFDESIEDFKARFGAYLSQHDMTFVLEAESKGKHRPVGFTSAEFMGPILLLGGTQWLDWASSRNRLETITHLLNELRKEYIVMFWSTLEDKEFYTTVAKHGVIRRIGTIYDLLEDGPAALFQTRRL